jgi:hypothetical protein
MAHTSHTSTATGSHDMRQPVIDSSPHCIEGFPSVQKLQLEAFEAQSEFVQPGGNLFGLQESNPAIR